METVESKLTLPNGWELSGYRPPKAGEYFISDCYSIMMSKDNYPEGCIRHIVKKVRPRAVSGETYYSVHINSTATLMSPTERFDCDDNNRYNSGNYFLTKADAEAKLAEINKILKGDY